MPPTTPQNTNLAFFILKTVAAVAELAIAGAIIYAATMAARYWSGIGV